MVKYVNSVDAAEATGIDDTTIRKWAKDGKIKGARKVGEGRRGIWQIPVDQFETIKEMKKSTGRPRINRG
jgi:predicted site-specific integrase-resolvase